MSKKKKAQMRPKVSLYKVILFGLKVNLSTMPVLFATINTIAIFHGISHGFATFMTQQFYDSVEKVIVSKGSLQYVYLMVAALGAAYICQRAATWNTQLFTRSSFFQGRWGNG
jgi:hypothetical protein